jgi:hypothetical protein
VHCFETIYLPHDSPTFTPHRLPPGRTSHVPLAGATAACLDGGERRTRIGEPTRRRLTAVFHGGQGEVSPLGGRGAAPPRGPRAQHGLWQDGRGAGVSLSVTCLVQQMWSVTECHLPCATDVECH